LVFAVSGYWGFNSVLYSKTDAKWCLFQENAALRDLQRPTLASKLLSSARLSGNAVLRFFPIPLAFCKLFLARLFALCTICAIDLCPSENRQWPEIPINSCDEVERRSMSLIVRNFSSFSVCHRSFTVLGKIGLPFASVLLAAAAFASPPSQLQSTNRITQPVDTSQLQALPNHHPLWATTANNIGVVPADLPLNQFTLVLARSAQQQQAFEQFLAGQQNPASPDYHHWLTPAEVGQRFGLSDEDIATISGWLQSQGLHVNWVSPSRIFIGFGGSAANVNRAFQTEMHYYNVRGQQRLSVNSDPTIPAAILPVITAIRGLYTIDEQPANRISAVQSAAPQLTGSTGNHYIAPADFNVIYDVPSSVTGAGMTIGIVGWSRTDFADFDNFRSKTGASFPNPTEVIPTAYGGIDPGSAFLAPPASTVDIGAQSEATLDVLRSGSVAPGANLLLVVSSQSGSNDGIGADAQYLVNTSPVPAQVMTISFGACESAAGSGGVAFWDQLFQTAAAEGISVFVSSGDSGASGCDTAFVAPPASPTANSPNYICSSSYATCVGGTQFADVASPSTYWSSTNSASYLSALSYIPEGAWNESTASFVAATGGGVSTIISTPTWQTGAGVPSARTGRYTPDVSFSASSHDGYFACMAAAGGSCVVTSGSFSFIAFSGTSAAAPGMAGVAALLDQKIGAAQGNLNPQIYPLAASVPSAFHDATVASSGVLGCSVNTPSTCNNSIPGATGNAAQAGFLLGTGFDEATGLGSLDVQLFLNNYLSSTKLTPTVTVTPSLAGITTAQSLSVTVAVSGGAANPIPTGSVFLTSGTYSSASASLVAGSATINVPAGSLAAGTDTLTATYSSDSNYNPKTGTGTVTVTQGPTFIIVGTAVSPTAGVTTGNTSIITVTPTGGFTGSVALTAAVTASPSGAVNTPTLSFGATTPVSLTSTSNGTATLTISTTASQTATCTAFNQTPRGIPWYAQGGAVLACLLLFGIAPQRRNWHTMLGALFLLVALTCGMLACGSGSTHSCPPTTTPGTTAGAYTITVTGTSGATTASSSITLTVQ
jgi:subtilase family serine protease